MFFSEKSLTYFCIRTALVTQYTPLLYSFSRKKMNDNIQMKKGLILICFFYCTMMSFAQSTLNFSVSSISGSYAITCASPTIGLKAASSYSPLPYFSWAGPNLLATIGNTAAVGSPGVYTIVATSGSVNATRTVAIQINTVVPVISYSPTSPMLWPEASQVTVTAITPSVNILQTTYNSFAPAVSSTMQTVVCQPLFASSVYTHCVTDLNNGCQFCINFFVMIGPAGLKQKNSSFGSDNNDVIIYPNPANNILNIQITDGSLADESCQLQITDCLGRKVKEEELHFINQSAEINTTQLIPGLYHLTLLRQGNVFVTQKLLVKHK